MTDTFDPLTGGVPLPPGVHPYDPSVPYMGGEVLEPQPIPQDTPGDKFTTGTQAFPIENGQALPVFQRAAEDWSVRIIKVNANSGSTAVAVGRQKGRQAATLSVPTLLPDGTVPLGVIFGPTEDEVQAGGNAGGILNPGDSVTINTEAPIFLGVIPGNATGACQVVIEFNPAVGVSF
jgi:hypothetical protein